jgi:hypothetical protein
MIKEHTCPKPNCDGHTTFATINKKVSIMDECFSLPFVCDKCGFKGKVWYNITFSGYEDMDGNEMK